MWKGDQILCYSLHPLNSTVSRKKKLDSTAVLLGALLWHGSFSSIHSEPPFRSCNLPWNLVSYFESKNTNSFFSLFHSMWDTIFLMLSSIFNSQIKVLGSTFLIFNSNINLDSPLYRKNIYLRLDPWYLTLVIDCSLFPAIHGCVPDKSLTHKRILCSLNALMVAGSIFQQRTSLRVIYLVNKLSK